MALAVQHLLVNHVEGLAPGFVGIGNEFEVERLLELEFAVRGQRIARDAEHDGAAFGEILLLVAKVLRLERTARRRVLRIEIHDDVFAFEIAQADLRVVADGAAQVWNFVTDFHGMACLQNFIGSMIASRFSPSQNSRKSSRSPAMCVSAGIPIVICAENMSAPVCIAR